MNCRFLYIEEDGFSSCDCSSPKAGGQINNKGTCNPRICKVPKKQREAKNK